MDSTNDAPSYSFKSKKIIESEGKPSPSPSAKPLLRHQDSNQWSSKTPEKPIDPPRRTRNRGAAFSLKEVREAARKLQKSGPKLDRPDPLVAFTEEQIPFSPVTKPKRPDNSFKIPERYEILDKFFNSLDSSIRLCRMKGSMTTFTNISPKIECLTDDRRFTYSHLAQIKFILPEAIEIKKILIHDERTSCMKPELLLALDVNAVEESKNAQLENGSILLRKIFRSRLVDFYKAHPEGDEIPEEVLPEPFNASKRAVQTKATFQESSRVTETLDTAPSEEKPHILSHMAPSFRRGFSQKAIARVTKQGAVASGPLSPVSGPSFSQTIPKDKCPLLETAFPRKLSSNAIRDVGTQDEVSSACLRRSSPLATPVKHTISDVIANPSAGTPVQSDSTPAKLKSATPMLARPKRCYMTPDNDITKSVNKLVRRPSRNRSLNFDTPEKNAKLEDDGDEEDCFRNRSLKFDTPEKNAKLEDDGDGEDCFSVDDDVLDVLPESLIRSIKEKETKALLEQDPAISQAKRRKQMVAGLPKLFDMIYFLFQSIRRSVLTKAELMHKIVTTNLDIVDRREVEDQLRLLQELAPEWIYEKLAASGDCLLCVNKISSPESIRSKLAEAK